MRKVLLSLVAIAAAVFATSCTNDLLDEGVKGGNRVTFNISTPELATRAFGDGATATDLYYAVYEGPTLLEEISVLPEGKNPVKLQGGKTSIMLDLASGIEYNLIFWAAAPDAIDKLYEVDFANKSMSLIEPDKFVSQNENLDAFYAYVKEVEAGKDEDVELYRPFAQLNVSVSDADILAAKNANLTVAETKVVVKNAYKTLNLVNGDVADEVAYTFDFAAAPKVANTPKAGYTLYSMNYLLVDDTKKLVEVEFAYNRAAGADAVNTRIFGNVPVQRNYRTNIYGDLLTKSTGFEVEIMEEWTEPAYGKVWDGVSFATPSFDVTNKVMYIHDGYQLAWLAQFVNNGNVAPTVTRAESIPFDNTNAWTVEITNDIDLGGNAWTPIGTGSAVAFCSNFNGNGHTIKGLKVEGTLENAGLFGAIGTSKAASIKNLTIDGAEIEGSHYAGAFAAWVQHPSDGQGNRITIENIHVKNSKVVSTPIEEGGVYDNGDKVGGVIGYAVRTVVDNCSAEKCEVTAYRDFAGVVGVANTNATVRNCSVKDVTLTINNKHNYKGYTSLAQYRVNSVTNVIANTATAENNSGEATIVDPITEAFKAAIAEGNITLKEDVIFLSDEALEIEAGEEVTIDLNGKTLTLGSEALINNGELTISGGNIEAPNGNGVVTNAGGKLTIEANVTAYEATIRALGGEVTINGGKFEQTGTAAGTPQTYRYGVDVREGGKVVINGGEFTTGNGLLNVNSGCELVINGGKFTNKTEKHTTRHFAYVSGKLTINDGEFYGVANSSAGGCFFCGAAAGCDITINGGKFTSLWTSGKVNRIFEVYFGGKIFVSGGLFNNKGGIEAYVEDNDDAATKDAYPYKANSKVVSDDATLANAVKADNAIVVVPAATYNSFPAVTGNNVTIVCKEGTVFEGQSSLDIKGATVVGATFSNPTGNAVRGTINGTLKNCTFDGSNGLRWCYAGETVVFENCVFSGDVYGAHFDGGANDVVFKNCTFSGFNAMGSAITKLTLEGCTFKANGRSGYNGINMWGNTKMVNCEFTFDGTVTEWIDAVGDNKTYEFVGCTVNGAPLTATQVGDYGTGNTITITVE